MNILSVSEYLSYVTAFLNSLGITPIITGALIAYLAISLSRRLLVRD